MGGEVRALRHVLAQQAVGVLVRAALPGTVRVAEVDLDARVDVNCAWADSSLPWSQVMRAQELSGRSAMAALHGLVDPLGVSAFGQVQQHHVPGGPLDQRSDRGAAVLADDEVALPVPGHRSVLASAGRSEIMTMSGILPRLLSGPARPALGPAAAQAPVQLPAQLASSLDEEGLVDRLVAHPHHRIVWELPAQAPGDLLGRPPLLQPLRHLLGERRMGQLRGLGPPRLFIGAAVRRQAR